MRKRMVDCPKCYGEGTYMLPVTFFSKKWERRTCDFAMEPARSIRIIMTG